MGSGQSYQNNHEHLNEQPEQQQIINSSVVLRSQVVKKRNISQDDDDDDEDDEEEELDSNDDSENEEQQFESNEYEEYVQGDKLVDNKSMYSGFLLNRIQLLAIKKITLNKKENFKIIKYNLHQLSNLRHQNLDTIISWSFENSNNNKKNYYLIIFSNFQSNGSLQSILQKYCKFSKELILTIFQQILKALEYLHSQNKLHKNLKTSNILVDHEGTILISDIIIIKTFQLHINLNAGCIFYELLTQKQPWQINDKVLSIQEIKKKFSLNQTFLKDNLDIQKNALNFLQQIFPFQPENRPSACQLLKHQIFLENSTSKFKQMAKQISQKEVQNTPKKSLCLQSKIVKPITIQIIFNFNRQILRKRKMMKCHLTLKNVFSAFNPIYQKNLQFHKIAILICQLKITLIVQQINNINLIVILFNKNYAIINNNLESKKHKIYHNLYHK